MGSELATVNGERIRVLSPGVHNMDAGPDFSNARLQFDREIWAGNVEIHVQASDWHRHHHDGDPAYDNVILHAVGRDDARISNTHGREIPQVIISYPDTFGKLYLKLSEKISDLPCQESIRELSSLHITDWVENLAVERMQSKARRILDTMEYTGHDLEQTCFITLARALGFGLNADPFEMMARSLPLRILHHHADDLFQIEALLFGQAGMLDMSMHIFDEYYQRLCREYMFLMRKYSLRPMHPSHWKYARTRPGNFPHRRIALLARMLKGGFSMMAKLTDGYQHPDTLRDLFRIAPEGYWADHVDFDSPRAGAPSTISEGSIDLLMINFVAPMLYAYGALRGDTDKAEAALDIWQGLPAERNTIIRSWRVCGISATDALQSQGLLQLRRQYCDMSRCLECRIGHKMLRNSLQIKNSKEREQD